MENDNINIYFAAESQPGLTMDKAQRLCVWADKMMMDAQAAISSINFVSEKEISLNDGELVTVIGDRQLSFDKEIKTMIALTSLMSWLHEAIKIKSELNSAACGQTIEEWAAANGIVMPESPTPRRDRIRRSIMESEVYQESFINMWEPEKVARYYRLKNTCAILHKLVGEDAPYETAIKRLLEISKKPREKSWHGDKLYVTEFTPSVDVESAIEQFNKYQLQHSQAQSELNAMKYELNQLILRHNSNSRNEFKEKYALYEKEMVSLRHQYEAHREQEIEKVRKLKIRIPENLMGIFNAVRSMGQEPIDVD